MSNSFAALFHRLEMDETRRKILDSSSNPDPDRQRYLMGRFLTRLRHAPLKIFTTICTTLERETNMNKTRRIYILLDENNNVNICDVSQSRLKSVSLDTQ